MTFSLSSTSCLRKLHYLGKDFYIRRTPNCILSIAFLVRNARCLFTISLSIFLPDFTSHCGRKVLRGGYDIFELTKSQSRRRENRHGHFPFQISSCKVDGCLLTRKECLKTIALSSENESHPNSRSNCISR